jgi:hypothetical protein
MTKDIQKKSSSSKAIQQKQKVEKTQKGGRKGATQLKGLSFKEGSDALSPRSNPDSMQQRASEGFSGGGGSLPHMDAIQASFGTHDVSDVKASVGGAATDACSDMGAKAYASGGQVAFKESPGVHLAAHEAAHVVQQRAGVSLKSGVGEVGDKYEQNADAVADAVVSGKSAQSLLDSVAPAGGSPSTAVQQKSVQLYTEVHGMPYDKVSDDGDMAVQDHGRVAWADQSKIDKSNAILKAQHSKALIKPTGGTMNVDQPGAPVGTPSKKLKKFSMVEAQQRHHHSPRNKELELVDDCGTANQQVMGAEWHRSWSFAAASKAGNTQEFTGASKYKGDDHAPGGIVSTTEKLSGEIYIKIFKREYKKTYSRTEAVKAWFKLSAGERAALSKKYGINAHAVPEVGQGITISSERDAPGATRGGYNFHFGYNLMGSGQDYVTLEDYASSGVKYYFDMYGPANKSQAWHQAPGNTDAMNDNPTTMVVTHSESLEGEIAHDDTRLLNLHSHKELPKLPKGTKVKITQKGNSWVAIRVMSGPRTRQVGWIPKDSYKDTR